MKTRAEVRTHFATLIRSEMMGSQDLLEDLFEYIPANPQGVSPFVSVVSAGTDRRNRREKAIFINVFWFVLAADAVLSIDEADAWAALDTIGEAFFTVLDTVRHVEGYWTSIVQEEPTVVDVMAVEGHGYLLEVCPLRFSLY